MEMGAPRDIRPGDNVILKLPNGELKLVKIPDGDGKGEIKLGKYGAFRSEHILGHPFGLSYEILDKKELKVVPHRTIEEIEETNATNELINDDGKFVQPLTTEEIELLKASGAHVTKSTRREKKPSRSTYRNNPLVLNAASDLRPHTLGQLLNSANVRPGARILVADDVSGLLVAAVLERLGGSGRCLVITDVDGPSAFPIIPHMNFEPEVKSSKIMSTLNWAAADEDYTPCEFGPTRVAEEPVEEPQTNKEKSKQRKRKVAVGVLASLREELFSGEFDGLVVASQFEPFSLVEKLSPYLAGSGSIAVYSPYIQKLNLECDQWPSTWLLQSKKPGIESTRLDSTLGSRPVAHYLFLGAPWSNTPAHDYARSNRVYFNCDQGVGVWPYDNPEASSVLLHRKELRAKRRKLAEEKAAESAGSAADDAVEEQDPTLAPAMGPEP
ncbi:Gcd10p domain-containing protein [Rhizoctonia solani AG-1 IA]|uniref:tRNA (adenine(58)-N(1))-methyltransferase non-catalytic subunit TRM6 n=1 Tax=Thanatephorus cucumeris (strain AG1-IA) TaxID=983506 RepID=L8WRR4_THACA|nr:Gcd10p domain-containing protein [Rhizoctonia solani AG-1 IA]